MVSLGESYLGRIILNFMLVAGDDLWAIEKIAIGTSVGSILVKQGWCRRSFCSSTCLTKDADQTTLRTAAPLNFITFCKNQR